MSGVGKLDFFYREAQRLGYVARSAFKLLQIQKQYKLITPGSSVLDLGCALVACQSLGPIKNGGLVVGIDLKVSFEQKVKVPAMHCDSRVQTVCADVMKLPKTSVRELSPQKGFSVILSDMCPLVSGIASKDAALSLELGTQALDLAVGEAALANSNNETEEENVGESNTSSDVNGVLRRGGHLVIKLLESEDVQGIAYFNRICKPLFRKASLLRPKATRSTSREIYLICQGLQSQART
ncbi:hypothetical protein ACLB2K_074690 [Fragaria x ananassa]